MEIKARHYYYGLDRLGLVRAALRLRESGTLACRAARSGEFKSCPVTIGVFKVEFEGRVRADFVADFNSDFVRL
jgi:hypothetical protein